jgi:predicted hotdog family 3-hydroxylacyl-ACP dehydratase
MLPLKIKLESLIPHQDRMCLLDEVLFFDDHSIICSASSHRAIDNPLREPGGLHVVAGIEYAAQAAAVHGSLRSSTGGQPHALRVLGLVSEIQFHQNELHALPLLEIHAALVGEQLTSQMYAFKILSEGMPVLSGRLGVFEHAVTQNP